MFELNIGSKCDRYNNSPVALQLNLRCNLCDVFKGKDVVGCLKKFSSFATVFMKAE